MAHFCVLVISSAPDDVADALEPFRIDGGGGGLRPPYLVIETTADEGKRPDPETGREHHSKNPIGMWDYWVIGGLWTGLLAPDHDPAQNIETCAACNGQGRLPSGDPCRRCAGAGQLLREDAVGDQCQARELDLDALAATGRLEEVHAVVRSGRWHGLKEARAPTSPKREGNLLQTFRGLAPDTWITVVDCHC